MGVVLGVSVVIVVGVVAYLLLLPRQSDHIAVPAHNATPEQVVTAYLDALNAHDCDTAETVMASDAKDSARSWCRQVASLTDVDVRDHFTERPELSGRSAPEEVANVPVTFDVDWRLFHGDVSMPEGTTTWGYLLVRDSPDSPWRIFGQGTG
nr:DUF4829 domain-containing protein [Nocardioides sp. zg-DK7169]